MPNGFSKSINNKVKLLRHIAFDAARNIAPRITGRRVSLSILILAVIDNFFKLYGKIAVPNGMSPVASSENEIIAGKPVADFASNGRLVKNINDNKIIASALRIILLLSISFLSPLLVGKSRKGCSP